MTDFLSGLLSPVTMVFAVSSVPDGLASAALAGVNPIYGLYTSIAAPTVGSLLVSAQLMQVATTSASASRRPATSASRRWSRRRKAASTASTPASPCTQADAGHRRRHA